MAMSYGTASATSNRHEASPAKLTIPRSEFGTGGWRADELRAAADGFADNSSRSYFLNAAKTYEILADNAEARLRGQKKPSSETG
jgi:hypothetical protein